MHVHDAPQNGLFDQRVVVFVDVLGFAALTEEHELDQESIMLSDRPLSLSLTYDKIAKVQNNALTRTFGGFHQTLKGTLQLAQMRHPLTAITFSDSAFIVTRHLVEAASLATDLVTSLMTQHIPVRIGIAYGSFAALRFRSDITRDGGDHAAHFLGTAVVRAHAAESCGIKGMRLLLHPSAVALLSDPIDNRRSSATAELHLVPCSEGEGNRAGVSCEVDYWRLRPTAEAAAWHALQDMWEAAPKCEHFHYQATAQAIDRMRVSQGAVPLSNLRRRTLPRTNPNRD